MSRSLSERLAALQQSVHGGPVAPETVGEVPSRRAEGATGGSMDLTALGFNAEVFPEGTVYQRVLRYDLLTKHGHMRFRRLFQTNLQNLTKYAKLKDLDPLALRFYDTETTGLGTGAGTIPFLHAVAQVEDDDLVLYQYFLHDYASEFALLRNLSERHFKEKCIVVTFNGKSFDWPLLRNRFALYRMDAPECAQLDLLYPSRRLWRARLERVSLGCVESGILDLHRTDDLPGKEAPARYFAYVESSDANLVEPVIEHNATDVCSLVTLLSTLSDALAGETVMTTAKEHVALGRLCDEWQEFDLAAKCFTAVVQYPDADWRDYWFRSMHFKRRGEWEQAVSTWHHMMEHFTGSTPPLVELAKFYEHRQHDYQSALNFAQSALTGAYERRITSTQGLNSEQSMHDEVIAALKHRIARITRKLDSTALRVSES
jgi:uncharacterized protein YprB with RNaseH-like and TPR domain